MTKQSLWQAIKYTLFSISAGGIQAISFALLFEVLFQSNQEKFWICHIAALVLSVLWNFTLNRKFTFAASNNIPIAMLKVAGFYLIFTPLSAWLGQLAANSGWNGLLVELLTMLTNFVLEFLYFKYVVFPQKKNTQTEKQ